MDDPTTREDDFQFRRRRAELPEAELWAALDGGRKLSEILTDFYDRVYEDAQLRPFFAGTTKQRAIEKQYSFLRQLFTGEKIYFGDRPRNAHHWMVVSPELFDYREALMESCLRRHGLSEDAVRRWRAIEERYRTHIVKSEPRPRRIRGEDLPLDGWETLATPVGTLCDGCSREVARGESMRCHVRTGKGYCTECAHRDAAAKAVTP